ncbi:hypothetical protein, partial [Limosilactobacillus fermentum]|uniref:hypothetical protein n=1 Tax=Limosilactobacillus fermentum TaxID=1613 RepID=UPI00301CC3AE
LTFKNKPEAGKSSVFPASFCVLKPNVIRGASAGSSIIWTKEMRIWLEMPEMIDQSRYIE